MIIHSYNVIDDNSPQFLQTLKNRSIDDTRIILFEGQLVGDFSNIVKYMIPLNSYITPKDTIIETLTKLSKK